MNVLLIVCDTLRADHLGCYGYFRNTSPNIDRIASEGVLLEEFYNSGVPTGPAFTCMYTGLHSIHHKYYQFIQPNVREVDDTIFTLPEILRAGGYITAAVDNLSGFAAHSKHWTRGYDYYINPSPVSGGNLTAEHVNRRLIPWIRHNANEDFFLFVHYWDPHLPYNQPAEYREIFHHEKGDLSDLKVKEAAAGYDYVPGWGKVGEMVDYEVDLGSQKVSIDLYDGEICYMDNFIGQVITALEDERIKEETVVIITSDHGENLGQHHSHFSLIGFDWQHGSLHDAVTHVPCIIRYPKKLPKGLRIKGFGQHIDLLPTVLDLIGAPNVFDIDGVSLLPLLDGVSLRDKMLMELVVSPRAIRTSAWKLIYAPPMGRAALEAMYMRHLAMDPDKELQNAKGSIELYDLKNDPLETINLAKKNNHESEELKEELFGWIRTNIREGEQDPIVYENLSELSLGRIRYREKIANLKKTFKTGIPF